MVTSKAILAVFLNVLVIIQCEELCLQGTCPIDGISHAKSVGQFPNTWHNLNEREMFGTVCKTMIKGTFYQSKWRWQGRFWCPALSTIEGHSKSLESREDVIEHAIYDYIQKGKQLNYLNESQLQNLSNIEPASINSLNDIKSRYRRALTYQVKRENQTKIHTNGIYYGDTIDDVRDGVGVYIWDSGDKYVGMWVNGKRRGIGMYYFPNGNTYVGQFYDDKLHGYGILRSTSGYTYKGDFLISLKWGYGEETWTDGDKYIGQFKNDQRHGFGYWFYASGKRRAAFYVEGTEI